MAGKRLGKEDDRHLWPEMLRAIREIQPRWVVGENVLGLVNWSGWLVFHEVQADLEAQGYEVQPFVLPAVSVNAPHRRERVWFVAHAKDDGYGRKNKFREDIRVQERCLHKCQAKGWDEIWVKSERPIEEWVTSHSNDTRADIGMRNKREWKEGDIFGGFTQPESWEIGWDGDATDADYTRLQGSEDKRKARRKKENGFNDGREYFSWSFCSKWKEFPTQSPICNGNDGISARLDGITFSKWRQESIKAGGNAVVPQVVLQIFKAIEEYEIMHAQ